MDLKSTINKTETLLNNVKKVKDQINQTVVRGGGSSSKSLNELPNNINKMLKNNYKKIAIMNTDISITDGFQTINLNLKFKPSRIIIQLEYFPENYIVSVDSYTQKDGWNCSAKYLFVKIDNISSTGFRLNKLGSSDVGQVDRITSIIAIE